MYELPMEILHKIRENKFHIFHEIPATSKSSLEKTTDRILLRFFLYEAYMLALYRKIIFMI